jgi:hypothetical protein
MVSAARAIATGQPWDNVNEPQQSYDRSLTNLAYWTQREWLNRGYSGWAGEPMNPKVKEAAVEEMTRWIYAELDRQKEED